MLLERQKQRGFIDVLFHLRERMSEIGVARPLDTIDLEFADQLAQMRHSLQQHASFVFGRHANGILTSRDCAADKKFQRTAALRVIY